MKKCIKCNTEKSKNDFGKDIRNKDRHKSICRECDNKFYGYNANSIKILKQEEIEDKFDWTNIAALAQKYNRDPGWIERGFEACRRCSVNISYFIERYLNGNRDIPQNMLVNEAFKDILKEKDMYGAYTRI